jgi:hypothetical protein
MSTKNRLEVYIGHIQQSIAKARLGISQLNSDILAIPGMSSPLVRHFLNNVCDLPNTSYLEIGCWQGSTLISALYGNKHNIIDAIAIDNWALHPERSIKKAFLQHTTKYLQGYPYRFFEQDCFTIQKDIFKYPVTVYFYDGNHHVASHEKAFIYFNNVFADIFIAIIDDWNWERVQKGTRSAFKKLNYQIIYEQEFCTKGNDPNDWWNGIYIAVITK